LAGFRALFVFGDKMAAGAAGFCLEAARVVLVAGALATGAGFDVAVRALFLTASAFSLSSLEISSLDRFLPRAAVFGAGLAGAGFGAGLLLVGAARVLRAAAGAGTAFLVTMGLGSTFSAGARSSMMGIWRLLAGMRLTRRSRRDCREAHCASHMALNFSLRALTTNELVSEAQSEEERLTFEFEVGNHVGLGLCGKLDSLHCLGALFTRLDVGFDVEDARLS